MIIRFPQQQLSGIDPEVLSVLKPIGWVGALTGIIMGAYHGYKRSGLGAALGYAILGSMWPIGIPVMMAQGFGKKRKRK